MNRADDQIAQKVAEKRGSFQTHQRNNMQKHKEYFSPASDVSPDCIGALNIEGQIERFNPAGRMYFEPFCGSGAKQSNWSDLWALPFTYLAKDALTASSRGKIASLQTFGPSGSPVPRWWHTTISPIVCQTTKSVVALIAISHDVTAEVDTRAFLDAIFESCPSALLIKNVDTGRFVLVNSAAEVLLGRSKEQLLGKTDHDVFPRAEADFSRATDLRAILVHLPNAMKKEVAMSVCGSISWRRTTKVPIFTMDGARHILIIAEDMKKHSEI